MSTLEAAAVVVVFLALSLGGSYAVLRWAMPTESTRDRIIREAHERAEVARRMDPLVLAATDPEWQAGFARLRQAIRDEQNGDTP